MKKHQLLEKAMRDYPAGTVARFKSAPTVEHTSDGTFIIADVNKDGSIQILSGVSCIYDSGEWAMPETPSILTGRCAIQVNNEREFKLLMEHYESNGWSQNKTFVHDGFQNTHNIFEYKNLYQRIDESNIFATRQYKIIPFDDFAKEVGVEVPEFVILSKDGVELYKGDKAHHVFQGHGVNNWQYNGHFKISRGTIAGNTFSTKEAAEKWIEEANRSKQESIKLFQDSEWPTEVTKEKIVFTSTYLAKSDPFLKGLILSPQELEDIYKAYKSL